MLIRLVGIAVTVVKLLWKACRMARRVLSISRATGVKPRTLVDGALWWAELEDGRRELAARMAEQERRTGEDADGRASPGSEVSDRVGAPSDA